MNDLTIIILGISAIIIGLIFWKRIQLSRKDDSDFERREELLDKAIDEESKS